MVRERYVSIWVVSAHLGGLLQGLNIKLMVQCRGSGTIFFRKLAVTVDSLGFFLRVLLRFQTDCSTPLLPLPSALWGEGGLKVTHP